MFERKGLKNVIIGLAYQVLVLVFGLVIPKLFITSFGSAVNGLLASVTQIYACLALLEAGVGTASLQALYRTLATDNKESTSKVMVATNYFYRRTGFFYLFGVLALTFLYPLVLKTDISYWVKAVIILFNGLCGVANYFFQGKYRILLQADGRSYLLSGLNIITYILSNVLKIVLICLGASIVWIQVSHFVLNLLPMAYIAFYIKRHYAWLDAKATADFQSISQKRSVLVHQISNLIFSNTDSVILSVVPTGGLAVVSVYTMYNNLYNTVKSVLFAFLDGLKFAMGQMFYQNFKEYLKLHDIFELYYMALTFAAYTLLHIFILPFLTIYTQGITDIVYVDEWLPILFTLVFLLQCARGPASLAIDFAEHFKKTQVRAIIEVTINLLVTIVAVFFWGIYGALVGTIAALLYRANDMIIYANRKILGRSPWITYKRWGINFLLFFVITYLFTIVPMQIESYWVLFLYAAISGICILVVYLGVASISEIKTCKNAISFLKKKGSLTTYD